MAIPEHYLDIEFDKKIKEYVFSEYPNYEDKLKEKHIVRDYRLPNENMLKLEESPEEYFYFTRRSEIRHFLVKELEFEYNGTGVWKKIVSEGDIKSYFEWLIEQY